MKIRPVSIKVKNLEEFTTYALLLDREDFLKDLYDFKRNLNIKRPYPILYTAGVLAKFFLSKRKISKKVVFNNKQITFSELQKQSPAYSYFLATDYLMRKYNIGMHFFAIITQALLSSTVIGNLYPGSAFVTLNPKDEKEKRDLMILFESEMNKSGDAKAILLINSRTTKKDVLELFSEAKKILPKANDTISNIKRDREWYWKNKLGLSASQIQQKSSMEISVKGVERAITQYKKTIHDQISKYPPTLDIS